MIIISQDSGNILIDPKLISVRGSIIYGSVTGQEDSIVFLGCYPSKSNLDAVLGEIQYGLVGKTKLYKMPMAERI